MAKGSRSSYAQLMATVPTGEIFAFRVLLMKEGRHWVAQCLEKDLAAQGRTIGEAQTAFVRTLIGQIVVDLQHKHRPFANLNRAPEVYEEMWSKGARLSDAPRITIPDEIRSQLPPAFMVDSLVREMRVGG